MATDIEQQKIIHQLQARVNTCEVRYRKLLDDYKNLRQSTLKFKIEKRLDPVFSVLAGMLTKSQEGTTLTKRLWMFASTMINWVKSGFKVEEEVSQIARLEICKACPDFTKETSQCKICGCIMSKKVKIASASCPLKKW